MIRLWTRPDGSQELELSHSEASVLQGLLCSARPTGASKHGRLKVTVIGNAAPPQEEHTPVCGEI